MDTTTKETLITDQAVIELDRSGTTASGYQPIVISPNPDPEPLNPGMAYYTTIYISANASFKGTVTLDVEFYQMIIDGNGGYMLVDNVSQIPLTNNGRNNRNQTVRLNGSTPAPVTVYVVPQAQQATIMVLARPEAESDGNVGVYFFTVPAAS